MDDISPAGNTLQASAKRFRGLYAAMGTPRTSEGKLDEAALDQWAEFLIARSVTSVVLNGATGECCRSTPTEAARMVARMRSVIGTSGQVLCGIGSGGLSNSLELGETALKHGADGLLLGMPYFFPYEQEDLTAFALEVGRQLRAPILLYNLPSFSTPLQPETVLDILNGSEHIVGIKDSAGCTDILAAVSQHAPHACRLVGNDGVFTASVQNGLCDGVISGVCGVFPELMRLLAQETPEHIENSDCARWLTEIIGQLDGLPTPWGLKWLAECREIPWDASPLPLSPRRLQQRNALRRWYDQRMPDLERFVQEQPGATLVSRGGLRVPEAS